MYGFWKNPSKRKPRSGCDGLNLLSMRNNHGLKKNVDRMPGATSGIISITKLGCQIKHKPRAVVRL